MTHKVSKYCEVFVHHRRRPYTSRAAVYVHRVSQAICIAAHCDTQALYCGLRDTQALYIRLAHMHRVLCIVRVYHNILAMRVYAWYYGHRNEQRFPSQPYDWPAPLPFLRFPQCCGKTPVDYDIPL